MTISKIEVLSIITKVVILVLLIGNLVYKVNEFNGGLPVPITISVSESKEDARIVKMNGVLKDLGCPSKAIPKISPAIIECSDKINIDPILIAVLMKTESTFDKNAQSPKGYEGLMQTPTSSGFEDVDTLHGCRKLEEKMKYAKGDIKLALALYKGGDNNMAHRQAEQVIKLYKKMKGEG